MIKPWRAFLVTTVAVALSACATEGWVDAGLRGGCSPDAENLVEAADWSTVRTVNIRIKQDEFDPMIISLSENKPYVLRFDNLDDYSHAFRAASFFRSVAVYSVVLGDRQTNETCLNSITIGAMQTAELRLVTTDEGSFQFEGNNFLIPSGGIIAVHPRYTSLVQPALPTFPDLDQPEPSDTISPVPDEDGEVNPFDAVEPPSDEDGEVNPFDAVEPPSDEDGEVNPFDAVEPPSDEDGEVNPFDAVEDGEASPFDAVEDGEASPFDAVEDDEASPFDAVEDDEASPFDAVEDDEPSPFDAVEEGEPGPFDTVEAEPEGAGEPFATEDIEPGMIEAEEPFATEDIEPGMIEAEEPFAAETVEPEMPLADDSAPAEPTTSPGVRDRIESLIDIVVRSLFKDQ